MVKYVENMKDFKQILEESEGKLVVVDFTAQWCGPCKMIAPEFERLAKENQDVVFLKVDVDEAEDIAAHYGITSMPTFIFFRNQAQLQKFSGASREKLEETIQKFKE
ncbi:unnamed protein product [Ophioblennius macclurei]